MTFKKNCSLFSLNSLIILLILITTVFVSLKFHNSKTDVLFVDLPDNTDFKVDQKTPLFLTKSKYYNLKRSLNNLSPGTHIIHYDASPVTRYYAKIEVKKGKNIIKPVFEYHSLPSLSIYRTYSNKSANKINNKKVFTYVTFSGTGVSHNNLIEIDINQEILKKSGKFFYNFAWDITLNDKSISSSHFTESDNKNGRETFSKQIIFQDSTHHYTAEYFFANGTAKLKIWSDYL